MGTSPGNIQEQWMMRDAGLLVLCVFMCSSKSLFLLHESCFGILEDKTFKTIVEFECCGFEPVDFEPQAGFAADGAESGTPFTDISLLEKDWNDYDEKMKESVRIYEVTHRFVKC